MKFTKVVLAASAVVGVVATYAFSFVATPFVGLFVGVQEQGVPAPVLSAPVYPGATLQLVPTGVLVDLLFWFLVSLTILAEVAELKE